MSEPWSRFVPAEVRDRVDRLELSFNRDGLDPYGISKEHLGLFYTLLGWLHRRYFRVRSCGIENVPDRGRAMLVANHSGGVPSDAAMIIAALFFDHEPPRHCHGMVEKFAQGWPFVSPFFSRVGQLPGLPEHAVRLLEDDRLLLVFPEGARGTGKLYRDRYRLVRFGTGFMRIAMQTRTPIVPLAFIGGEESLPTIWHANRLARLTGAPYWPVPPYLLPIPLPVFCEIRFGRPLFFEGSGTEPDEVIEDAVERVRGHVQDLIAAGRGRPTGD